MVARQSIRRGITVAQIVLAACVLAACAWLAWKWVGYTQANGVYEQLRESYAAEVDSIDFATLSADYPGAVAWITVDGLDAINYPVMQASDNDYYLSFDATGASSVDGAVFLDYRNESITNDLHAIVYAHNMADGSMFGTLSSFLDQDFYQTSGGMFTVYTAEGTFRYQVFAVQIVDPSDDAYMVGFTDKDVFDAYVQQLAASSVYDTGVTVTGNDQIVTLSTCSSSNRLIVSAKRVAG
ncbi:MAG: class B sortase [Eggerthellaceae bacterium]|nr:class B sortase [Eggerthellaceae bacterium]